VQKPHLRDFSLKTFDTVDDRKPFSIVKRNLLFMRKVKKSSVSTGVAFANPERSSKIFSSQEKVQKEDERR
jgi:vesicle coat complex subunit